MTTVMRPSLELTNVYLYRQAIDFRKSHRSLAAIVECGLGHNPFDGGLYAFTNKQRSKIKCLFWENTGFVLYYKALAEDKSKWPKGDESLLTLTGQQLNWLLDGDDISVMKAHKSRRYESVFKEKINLSRAKLGIISLRFYQTFRLQNLMKAPPPWSRNYLLSYLKKPSVLMR